MRARLGELGRGHHKVSLRKEVVEARPEALSFHKNWYTLSARRLRNLEGGLSQAPVKVHQGGPRQHLVDALLGELRGLERSGRRVDAGPRASCMQDPSYQKSGPQRSGRNDCMMCSPRKVPAWVGAIIWCTQEKQQKRALHALGKAGRHDGLSMMASEAPAACLRHALS